MQMPSNTKSYETFDGTIKTTTTLNKPRTTGITIYKQDNTTVITYTNRLYNSINQFNVEYTTRPDITGEIIKLIDSINFNIDDYSTAIIETNTVPYEELNYTTTSDIGIRNQLAKQNNYNGNILTSTYAQICNNNIPTIKYTKNHNNIYYNINGEPDYNYFINNPNIYKTIVTINNKQNTRTFTLSHQDQETILKNNTLTQTQKIQQLQNMTLKYTGCIQSYAIATTKISGDDFNTYLNKNLTYYNILPYSTFLVALKTINCYDDFANAEQLKYGLTWNRTSSVTMECYINASQLILNSLNPYMDMIITGEDTNKLLFTMTTTSMLNIIESEIINHVRNKSTEMRIESNTIRLLNKLEDNAVNYAMFDELLIIWDYENQTALSINLETGEIIDYGFDKYGEYGHQAYDECPNCMFIEKKII